MSWRAKPFKVFSSRISVRTVLRPIMQQRFEICHALTLQILDSNSHAITSLTVNQFTFRPFQAFYLVYCYSGLLEQ